MLGVFSLIGFVLYNTTLLLIVLIANLFLIMGIIIALCGIKKTKQDMAKEADVVNMNETDGQELILVYFYFALALTIFCLILAVGSLGL